MSQKIRIKLKSYDHNLVDKSAEKIVRTVKATGAIVSGPIPLPTHKRIFTVNRSTFVNKKSREQFELSSYKRLIDIYSSTAKTVDALMKLGFQDMKEKHTTKPLMGHFKKAGVTPKRHLAEFKDFSEELNLGDTITVELFNDTAYVDVIGTSKGKGFQGVVKRHGFGGVGQTTHGQHNRARKPGSIGACSYPAKVFKGMRMGGQMGGDRVTTHNLQVLKVIPEHNLLLIKGSVPGCKGSIVIIEK